MRKALWIPALVLVGCGGGLEGYWLGDLECVDDPFDLELDLSKTSGGTYEGTGVQSRIYDDIEGNRTDVRIDFSATLTTDGKGSQLLGGGFTCTDESTVRYEVNDLGQIAGDGKTISEGCQARRYVDYTIDWDGGDTISISGPDGCSGSLTRK